MTNEMTHLTAEERGTLDRARETPFARGIFDHSRTGYGCNCGWASKVHGDTCPEHGNPARRTMEIDASTVEKLLANLNAARAKLASLETAASGVLDWYHCDGSVGGACDPMESLRDAVTPAESALAAKDAAEGRGG